MILRRKRYFLALEGESELAFAKWLYELSLEKLPIQLDYFVVQGGGYKSMLEDAVRQHERRVARGGPFRARFLIVDEDRSRKGDWSIAKLRQAAAEHDISVCLQRPNYEGVLLRLFPGKAGVSITAASVLQKLRKFWPDYEKGATARQLAQHFTLEDLLRMAKKDRDFLHLLETLGMIETK